MSLKSTVENFVNHAKELASKLEALGPEVKPILSDLKAAVSSGRSALADFESDDLKGALKAGKPSLSAITHLTKAVEAAHAALSSS